MIAFFETYHINMMDVVKNENYIVVDKDNEPDS